MAAAQSMSGWLKDKYCASWQIIPKILMELPSHKDCAKADKAMLAMLKMKKISIQGLLDAAIG
jgi:predicted 3-demethylubiquinone-9 3-methyltransferase (glyoxalase superfamily)